MVGAGARGRSWRGDAGTASFAAGSGLSGAWQKVRVRSLKEPPPPPPVLPSQFQSQVLTVRSSKYMVFDKKSIPMVAC